MRAIERTTQFRRDLRRELKGRHRSTVVEEVSAVVQALVEDRPLHPRHRDHGLIGTWADYRDCHVRPDLILIYRLPDDHTLQLVRLGSHSELAL